MYRDMVKAALDGGRLRVLHAGCGRDKRHITHPYRAQCEVIGIDLDAEAGAHFHSTFVLGSIEDMRPFFPDGHFDVICCEYVIEHVDAPEAAFREFTRVLKPGGRLLLATPNFYGYKSLVAWLLPQSLHFVLGRRRFRTADPEMYPTLYRCNTGRALSRAASAAGLTPVKLSYRNCGVTWLRDVRLIGRTLRIWHRLLDWPALAWVRCAIVAEFAKP